MLGNNSVATIAKDNQDQEQEQEELDPKVPSEAMANVDMTLPSAWEDEVLAAHLLQIIASFHVATAELRAFRQIGNSEGIGRTTTMVAAYRAQAALIQYEHPNTIPLYKELAERKAADLQRNRRLVL